MGEEKRDKRAKKKIWAMGSTLTHHPNHEWQIPLMQKWTRDRAEHEFVGLVALSAFSKRSVFYFAK